VATLVIDPGMEQQLLERRRASRGDRWDEVWDGVYIMAPLPNIEHQELLNNISVAISNALAGQPGVRVFPGVNVSDRKDDWERNYRCPDVAVVLPDSRAVACGAFYFGGPDFIVEVASDYDRSRDKFDFYASVGVREFLLVDRNPWQLELYALRGKKLALACRGDVQDSGVLASQVLPLTFQLIAPPRPGRPQIEIVRTTDGQRWVA
jgi:Uma2 family endonuclease